MKGVTLQQGTVVVLALDGTLAYVETIESLYAGIVVLPEQPAGWEGSFTTGRVGMKKISPFCSADRVVPIDELSERNRAFIENFEKLRAEHGNNYVEQTEAEKAAAEAKNLPPVKKPKRTAEEKAAAKAAKKGGPKFLQKCTTCGEQPGHPNHGTDGHEFAAPAPPPVLCAACDEPESHDAHSKSKADGGHKYIAGRKVSGSKPPRASKDPAVEKPAKVKKEKPPAIDPARKFKWTGDDKSRAMLAAMNPKYKNGNSGAAIIEAVKVAADGASIHDVAAAFAVHEKWAGVSLERLTVAFTQLLGAELIG